MSVGSGQDLRMDVFRWSTDDERNTLVTALKDKNDKAFAEAVQKAPSLGSIWTNESLGYAIRYAYHDVLRQRVGAGDSRHRWSLRLVEWAGLEAASRIRDRGLSVFV